MLLLAYSIQLHYMVRVARGIGAKYTLARGVLLKKGITGSDSCSVKIQSISQRKSCYGCARGLLRVLLLPLYMYVRLCIALHYANLVSAHTLASAARRGSAYAHKRIMCVRTIPCVLYHVPCGRSD